jgi:hypothetical protein
LAGHRIRAGVDEISQIVGSFSPKVSLVISASAPPKISGTATVMFELLRHFPPDSAILVTLGNSHGTSRDDRQLRLRTMEPATNFVGAFRLFLVPLTAFLIMHRLRIAKAQVNNILGIFPSLDFLLVSVLLSRLLRVKLFVYLHDCIEETSTLPVEKQISRIAEYLTFKCSAKVYSISDCMKEYYQSKGFRTETLPHGVDSSSIRHPSIERRSARLKVGFAGMIYATNEDAIKELVAAKNLLEGGFELHFATTQWSIGRLRDIGVLQEIDTAHTYQSRGEVLDLLADCDILFLPMSFSSKHRMDLVSIFPTKVTDYWLAQRPIIVYGSSDYMFTRRANEDGYAKVVTERGPEYIARAIEEVRNSFAMRDSLVRASQRMILRHESKTIARKLMDDLEIIRG